MLNTNMELLNQEVENLSSNIQLGDLGLSNEGFSNHHQRIHHIDHDQIPMIMAFNNDMNLSSNISNSQNVYDPVGAQFFSLGGPTYGINSIPESDFLMNNISTPAPPVSIGNGKANGNYQNCGGRKRKRKNDREADKPREVVHVRAKRGQATDSHSLAERLRREKINEKLRSLQELVPGCYKTMGMAVMLDVIINYVRSLQNQIDFLSMKLSAASLFYDFNSSEMEAMDSMQGTNVYEAQGMGKIDGEGYGGFPHFQPSWPSR